jgi:hypothetical protein
LPGNAQRLWLNFDAHFVFYGQDIQRIFQRGRIADCPCWIVLRVCYAKRSALAAARGR